MTAEKQFERLAQHLTENNEVVLSQMFGKQQYLRQR